MIKYISLSSVIAKKLNFQKFLLKIMYFELCHCFKDANLIEENNINKYETDDGFNILKSSCIFQAFQVCSLIYTASTCEK